LNLQITAVFNLQGEA